MLMMALLPPGGLLGGYGGDPDGVNGSWEKACTLREYPHPRARSFSDR